MFKFLNKEGGVLKRPFKRVYGSIIGTNNDNMIPPFSV